MSKSGKGGPIALGHNAMAIMPSETMEPMVVAQGFTVTANGLEVTGNPPITRAEMVGRKLCTAEKGIQFALGDFIVWCETTFGEEASQIIDFESGWKEKTVAAYRWLATRVPKENRRMDRLGVAHHILVAKLSTTLQAKWLAMAAADNEAEPWTVSRLRKALAENEDLPETAWWVLVETRDSADQEMLMRHLEEQGRTCKAVARRSRRGE